MSDHQSIIEVFALGRNEGDRLKRCVRSVPIYVPVAYVCNASTDGSVAFARSKHATVVEPVMSRPFSGARARNEGYHALQSTNLRVGFTQFINRDCELEPKWLRRAMQSLETRPTVAAVWGRQRERFPDASLYNRVYDDEWNTLEGQTDAYVGDALMRVYAFRQVGGYDPARIAGEEPELCQPFRSAGWRILRLNAPTTIHDAAMHRFSQYWNRAIRSGFGYAQVLYKIRASAHDLLYQRDVMIALFWTLGVTLPAIVSAVIFGLMGLFVALAIWLLQLLRLGLHDGFAKGGHVLVGTIAEAEGILGFVTAKVRGISQGAIFYK